MSKVKVYKIHYVVEVIIVEAPFDAEQEVLFIYKGKFKDPKQADEYAKCLRASSPANHYSVISLF